MNTKAQEFAKEIYRQYREVIDFILENGESSILEAGANFIEKFNSDADVETKVEKYEKVYTEPNHFVPNQKKIKI